MRADYSLLAVLAMLAFQLPSPACADPDSLVAVGSQESGGLLASQGEDPRPDQQTEKESKDDLEELRRAAQSTAADDDEKGEETTETTFVSGALGLQALNPEISVTGDFLSSYRAGSHVMAHFENSFRGLGLHLEAYLDPFSKFKAAVPISSGGAELGEAYFTRFGLLSNVSFTLGKFRQQFGVVNRWHKHAVDQVDFPLPLRQIFGPGGLNQVGFSAEWQMPPLGRSAQGLTFELTNGQNPAQYAENTKNVPSLLLRYKNYQDLSKDTYLEIGLTGLAGRNDTWTVPDSLGYPLTKTENLWTTVLGADLTLLWEPTDRMRYRNWVWRTELYLANKKILAPDGSGESTVSAWGAYSYYQTKVSRTLDLGARLDYYEPDVKAYAGSPGSLLWPLATSESAAKQWLSVAYLTWSQSPWVHWRLEWDHQVNHNLGPDDNTFWLQCVFAAGPHKHERY